jgi:DNA-binding beta-propeller fold protein YncE
MRRRDRVTARGETMAQRQLASGLAVVVLAAAVMAIPMARQTAARRADGTTFPVFEPDATFPKLPNEWVLGSVSKIVVDRHDNVWLIHRPRTVAAGRTSAPPVVEFDAAGKFLQAWGGPADGYDWPDSEHNVFVDHHDNVWISGSSPSGQSKTKNSDDMLLKFTSTGKLLWQMGGRTVSGGSRDTKSVNKPGDLFVSAKTNEIYLADGYGNRRVIVLDAERGTFKRMWAAFGKEPRDDASSGGPGAWGGPAGSNDAGPNAPRTLDIDGDGPPTFASPVHSVVVSNDDMVYVADRSNRRVQVFTTAGQYRTQMFVNRAGPASGSVSGLAFSPDKNQQFLYMADYGNSHIVVVDRKKLEVLYQFGRRGPAPGDFQGVHHLAVDSKGNLYTAEVAPGARAQRFVFKGMSPTVPSNALTADQLSAKP